MIFIAHRNGQRSTYIRKHRSSLFAEGATYFSFYRLEIQTNPICFREEINIRKFFHDFYYESEITAHTIFPPIAIQNITASAFSRCYQLDQHACSFGEQLLLVYHL